MSRSRRRDINLSLDISRNRPILEVFLGFLGVLAKSAKKGLNMPKNGMCKKQHFLG